MKSWISSIHIGRITRFNMDYIIIRFVDDDSLDFVEDGIL